MTRDDVLDNITFYWLTTTAISSGRLYWENKLPFFDPMGVSIPVAVSVIPDEIYTAPRSWTERAYPKLIHYSQLMRAGTSRPGNSRNSSSRSCARASSRCVSPEVVRGRRAGKRVIHRLERYPAALTSAETNLKKASNAMNPLNVACRDAPQSTVVPIENEPAPRLTVEPPLPGPLSQRRRLHPLQGGEPAHPAAGRFGRTQRVPACRPSAYHGRQPALAWADYGQSNTIILIGMPRGRHKLLIELVDAEGNVFTAQTVTFDSPGKPEERFAFTGGIWAGNNGGTEETKEMVMKSKGMRRIGLVTALVSTVGAGGLSAQDKYTLKVPGDGLAFSEFRDTKAGSSSRSVRASWSPRSSGMPR